MRFIIPLLLLAVLAGCRPAIYQPLPSPVLREAEREQVSYRIHGVKDSDRLLLEGEGISLSFSADAGWATSSEKRESIRIWENWKLWAIPDTRKVTTKYRRKLVLKDLTDGASLEMKIGAMSMDAEQKYFQQVAHLSHSDPRAVWTGSNNMDGAAQWVEADGLLLLRFGEREWKTRLDFHEPGLGDIYLKKDEVDAIGSALTFSLEFDDDTNVRFYVGRSDGGTLMESTYIILGADKELTEDILRACAVIAIAVGELRLTKEPF